MHKVWLKLKKSQRMIVIVLAAFMLIGGGIWLATADERALAAITLTEAEELSNEEFEAIASVSLEEAVAAAEDEEEEEDSTYTLDGTTIESIKVSWLTEDDEEDGDSSRLTLVKDTNDEFSVKIRITFELSGQYDYEPGDITITIPGSIFTTRDGSTTGTITLSVPEATDTSATFNYTQYTDEETGEVYYVLTNTKTLSAATSANIELSFRELIPSELIGNGELDDDETSASGVLKYISDAFSATITVTTHNDNTITMTSNSIDASIDTTEEIGKASVRSDGISTTWPSDWDTSLQSLITTTDEETGEETVNDDDYIYVVWYSWVSVDGNQYYSMDVTSTAGGYATYVDEDGNEYTVDLSEVIILGMSSSYTGVVANTTSSDTMTLSITEEDYLDSGSTGYYVYTYVAIPKSAVPDGGSYTFTDSVTYTLTSVDDGEKSTSTAESEVSYAPTGYTTPEGFFDVTKSGNRTYSSALDSLRAGNSITAAYDVTSYGFMLYWTEDGDTVTMDTDDYAVRFNYNLTDDLTTDDFEFYSVSLSSIQVFDYVQFTSSGSGYVIDEGGTGVTQTTIQAGSWGFQQTSDTSQYPVIYIYGRSDNAKSSTFSSSIESADTDEWTLYASISWETGSMVITTYNDATTSGSTIYFPSGVSDIRSTAIVDGSEAKCDGLIYTLTPTIKLKATDAIIEIVEELFEDSDSPSTILRNYAQMSVYETDKETEETEEIGETRGPRTGDDTLTGSSLAVTMTKDVEYENDVSNSAVNLHYTSTVYEHSNLTTYAEYKAALEAGAFAEETSGVFYDLLPEGVVVDTSSITMNGSGDTIESVVFYEDYLGSGRTLMVVTVSLTPSPEYMSSSVSGSPYSGYCDSFTLEFDAVYSWESMTDYSVYLNNVIAFESGNDELGTIAGYSGETSTDSLTGNEDTNNNQTESAINGVEEIFASILASASSEEEEAYMVFANAAVTLDVDTTSVTSITKKVTANGSGVYSDGLDESNPVNVYENGYYTYRIQVLNDDESQSKNIVIYDDLENYTPDDSKADYEDYTWRGTLISIDTSVLEDAGVAVKVYYSTSENLKLYTFDDDNDGIDANDDNDEVDDNYLLNTEVWTELESWDEESIAALVEELAEGGKTITALAFDCRTAENGNDFILGAGESISVLINMQAPEASVLAEATSDTEASDWYDTDIDSDDDVESESGISGGGHAYNNVILVSDTAQVSTGTSAETSWTSQQLVVYDYTKVGLMPFSITVTKDWDDADNQDGLRTESVTLYLLADGEIVTLADGTQAKVTLSEDNEWTYTFEDLPVLNEDGEVINYTIAESTLEGYSINVVVSKVEDEDFYGYVYNVTNVHVPETIDIEGTKTWDYSTYGSSDTQPDSVLIKLYADGVLKETQTVSANANGVWSYAFYNLDKYTLVTKTVVDEETGEETTVTYSHEIVYTIEEEYVEGYVFTVSDDLTSATNTYYPYGDLQISKTVVDATSAEDNVLFSFVVTILNEEGDPASESYTYVILDENGDTTTTGTVRTGDTLQITSSQTIVIQDINSEYSYTVSETNLPSGFTYTSSSGSSGSIYAGQTSTATFSNTYDATGSVNLSATKKLSGRTLESGQFSFTLYDEDGSVLRSVTNALDGSITFGAISYTLDDVGKTYTYTIKETDAQKSGYTYDSTVYTVKVTISDNGDGTLTCTPTYYDADGNALTGTPTFNNSYTATGSTTFTAWKTLTGGDLSDYTFTFQVTDEDGKVLDTVTNTTNGVVSFKTDLLSFTQDDVGKTYTYYVSEVIPDEDDENYDEDVVYDTTVYVYSVTVVDNGDGTLSFNQTITNQETGEEETPIFANGLDDGILEIQKLVETASSNLNQTFTFKVTITGGDVEDGEYTYTLKQATDSSEESTDTEDNTDDTEDTDNEDEGVSALSLAAETDEEDDAIDSEESVAVASTSSDDGIATVSEDSTSEETASASTHEDVDITTLIASGTSGTCSWMIDANGVLYIYPTDGTSGVLNAYTSASAVPWYSYNTQITAVVIESGATAGTSAFGLFYGCTAMTSFSGDGASGFITSNTTSLMSLFNNCQSLTTIDGIESWNTSNVTNMSYMFRYCYVLESLDLSNWDTSSVTTMTYMFIRCTALTSLDVASWNTSTVTNMSYMFYYCSALENLDLSNWDVSSVTTMLAMFDYCSSLTSIGDLSEWNTKNVTTFKQMFQYCASLLSLGDISQWNTSSVTGEGLCYMFDGCSSLVELNLSDWDVSGATAGIAYMFQNCTSLTSLNLENWVLPTSTLKKSSTYIRTNCFYGCTSLSKITLGSGWHWKYKTASYKTSGNNVTSTALGRLLAASSDVSTGNWIRVDENGATYGSAYSVSSLVSNWSSSLAGTWVWQYYDDYTVNYDANCDTYSGSMASGTWTGEDLYTVAECSYYRFGYTFVEWNTASDGSGTSYAEGDIMSKAVSTDGSAVTLYAIWEKTDTSFTVEDGVFYITLKAGEVAVIDGLPAGATYTIEEQTESGWVIVSSSNTSGTISPNTTSVASYTNSYSVESTSVQLTAVKTLDGEAVAADAYSFSLYEAATDEDTDTTTLTLDDGSTVTVKLVETVSNSSGGGITFSSITYSLVDVGMHTYYIVENVPDSNAEDYDSSINYDTSVEMVTVKVEDDGEGVISATVTYDETDSDPGQALFENETITGSLTIQKTLTGNELVSQSFTVNVTFYKDGITTSETVTLDSTNEWTYTWYELAPGTTYTISETNIPDGYSLTTMSGIVINEDGTTSTNEGTYDSSTQTYSGTIASGASDTVTVTNAYASKGSFNVVATKTLEGRDLTSGEFTFYLIDEDGNTIATATNDANGAITFDAVSVSKAGVYVYYIVEVDNSDSDATVDYDDHVAVVTVVASDNGDGSVTCTVYYGQDGNDYLNSTDDSSSDSSDTENTSWWDKIKDWLLGNRTGEDSDTEEDEIATPNLTYIEEGHDNSFTNTVKTGDLVISKTVTGTSATSTAFTFEVTLTDASGNALTGEYAYVVYEADGTVSSDEDATGTITSGDTITLYAGQYAVVSDIPSGTSYTVQEVDIPSGYTVETASMTGSIVAESQVKADFTNQYAATSTSVIIKADKVLDGKTLTYGDFTFTLIQVDEDGNEIEGGTQLAAKNTADGTVTFDAISYKETGIYYYKIAEQIPDDAVWDDDANAGEGGYVLDSITYDTDYFIVTVTVSDDNGTLVAMVDYGEDYEGFFNVYEVKQAEDTIKASKEIAGDVTIAGGEFLFTLIDSDGNIIDQAENAEDGQVLFETIYFTEPGTYVYILTETYVNELAGISYDRTVYTITYTVWEEDGELQFTKVVTSTASEGEVETITFSNPYSDTEVYASFNGIKIVVNADQTTRVASDDEFTFTIVEVDQDGNEIEGGYSQTVTNTGSGFSFDTVCTFTTEEDSETEGAVYVASDNSVTKYYKITEVAGEDSTITYDETSYIVSATATNNNGYLYLSYGDTVDEEGNTADSVMFINIYTPTPTTVSSQLSGKKILNGRTIEAGEFTFVLKDADGNVLETVTNDADGTFAFSEITYDTIGEYVYTVSEISGDAGGVTFDDAVYTVRIYASEDDELHALEAEVTYSISGEEQDSLTFTNEYTATPVSVTLSALKVLKGKGTYATKTLTLETGQFMFELVDEEGNVIATATNDAEGNIVFETIEYDEAGTYTYVMCEVIPEGDEAETDLVYDTSEHIVIVTVTDDGEGMLLANVSYDEGTSNPVFTNTYDSEEPEEEGDDDSTDVATMDESHTKRWLMLLLASAGVLVVAASQKRKRFMKRK